MTVILNKAFRCSTANFEFNKVRKKSIKNLKIQFNGKQGPNPFNKNPKATNAS